MPMKISYLDACALQLDTFIFKQLEQIGHGYFIMDNKKIKTNDLTCQLLAFARLWEVMETKLAFDKSVKNDFKAFVKAARREATSCKTFPHKSKKQKLGLRTI